MDTGETLAPKNWAWLDAIAGTLDDDFVKAVNEQPGPQHRPALEDWRFPPRRVFDDPKRR
jgi:hypothetical protein